MAATRQLTGQGLERKQQLLDRSAVLFAERGYDRTRVADICEAAGVAKGLFYWYFENKEALFAELVSSMRLRLRRAQAEAMDPTDDPLTQLRAATEASVRFMCEHATYFALLETHERGTELARLAREGSMVHLEDSVRLIERGIEQGAIPDTDASALALGVIGAVVHFCHHYRLGRIACTVDELAAFVGRWVVGALSAEAAPLTPRPTP